MTAVDTIIDNAQSAIQYSDQDIDGPTTALSYLNEMVYHPILSAIENIDEDYFYTKWDIDAVAAQTDGAYSLTIGDATTQGLRRILRVEILMDDDDDYYKVAERISPRDLTEPWDYYLAQEGTSTPKYFIAENKIYIAPQFSADRVGGAPNNQIRIWGIASNIDLVAGGAETTILIPRIYHNVLILGLKYYLLDAYGEEDRANRAFTLYEASKERMLQELTDRDRHITLVATPDTSTLE
jgi:hypothetical protein